MLFENGAKIQKEIDKQQQQRKQQLNIPKTLTTRSGPLYLFSQDVIDQQQQQKQNLPFLNLQPNQNKKNKNNDQLLNSLKTTRDLRNSILNVSTFYEIDEVDEENDQIRNENLQRENTLVALSNFHRTKLGGKKFNDHKISRNRNLNASFEQKRSKLWRPDKNSNDATSTYKLNTNSINIVKNNETLADLNCKILNLFNFK